VEPGGQYFEGQIESASDCFLVGAFAYGIEEGRYRPKAEFFQDRPSGRQLGVSIGRSVVSEIIIAHAVFDPLLLEPIGLWPLSDAVNITSEFVALLIQLLPQGDATTRDVSMTRRRLTRQLSSQTHT